MMREEPGVNSWIVPAALVVEVVEEVVPSAATVVVVFTASCAWTAASGARVRAPNAAAARAFLNEGVFIGNVRFGL